MNFLLLHGHASSESLAPIAGSLSEHGHVHLDVRQGYDGTEALPNHAPHALAERIEEDYGAQGPWVVVGHSYGAYLTLLLALRGRMSMEAAVCLAPLAHMTADELSMMPQAAEALAAGANLAESFLPLWFSARYREATPGLADQVREWVVRSRPGLVADLRATLQWEDLRPRLGSIGIPVLLRVGDEDVPTPVARAREIAEAIPAARLEVAEGRGHMLGMEDGAGVVGIIGGMFGLKT